MLKYCIQLMCMFLKLETETTEKDLEKSHY